MDLWETMAEQRLALADQLAPLTDDQWRTPSLCAGWTVRDVLAHLVVPHVASTARVAGAMLRSGLNFDRANRALTAREAQRPVDDLLADLRAHAAGRFAPPGLGVEAPLTDVLVHGQDIRVPLGLTDPAPFEVWARVLDFAVSPKARLGFTGRLPAVRWVATDGAWVHGEGPQVNGPAAAMALAMLGRSARLGELTGPGLATVTDRLRQRGGGA